MAKKAVFATLVDDSKQTISIDLLCLQVARMPRYPDLVIFVLTTDEMNKPITLPLAHARWVIILCS